MKFALATATAVILTATTSFAAGVEGQGPDLDANVAPTTGQIVSLLIDGPVGEQKDSFEQGASVDVTVFEASNEKASGGAYYR